MRAIERILVVADPTAPGDPAAQPAARRGFDLARRLNAEIRLFVVCDYNEYLAGARLLDPASLQRAQDEYVEGKRAWLERLASALDARSLRVSLEMAWARPLHNGITRQVLRYQPDLVLKDTHPHPAMERALFTNTDWQLIRECPAPLLLVRSEEWRERPRILAAVDPMNENDKPAALDASILDIAGHLAQATGGELHVLHVFELIERIAALEGNYVPVATPTAEIAQRFEATHRQALDRLVSGRNIPRERVQMRAGEVRRELREVARTLPASLVVMGAVARGRLERVFVGSTAEQVLDSLPCDVLVVKPEGFRTPVGLVAEAGVFEVAPAQENR
jgi:universal stress protein E